MAFDSTQPTDTTKIRNLSNVITPNWVAEVDGDLSYKQQFVNISNRGNVPANAASTYRFYSKDPGTGTSELYGINSSGDTYQMSVGAPTIATTGSSFLPGGIIIKWGSEGSTANNAVILFSPAFPNNCFNVQVTANTGSAPAEAGINGFNASQFIFKTTTAQPFTWVAIGN